MAERSDDRLPDDQRSARHPSAATAPELHQSQPQDRRQAHAGADLAARRLRRRPDDHEQRQVTLLSGIYVIDNGPLVVDHGGALTGSNVGLYFTGDKGGLLFDVDSTIRLTAPKDGPMAGLLFFEN